MTDILDRLKEACVGAPHAKIAWPHRPLHDAIEEIERLRAALRQPAQGWMPIETAPKGELDALVIDVFGNIFHGLKGLNEKWSAENPAGGGDYYIRTGRITHWMPLPAAPDVGEVG